MSTKARKQTTTFEIDKINKDLRENNDIGGTIDRERMSWILNSILNQKTQQEIVKDIADGILDFKEIEEMFPWNYVQKLRENTPRNVQNYLNRFKNVTDERMKRLLNLMLSRKSREEMLQLITDRALDFDNVQKSYLRSYVKKRKNESKATSNVPTSSRKWSSKSPSNDDVKNNKEPKDVDARKKRSTAKKGEKETDAMKDEIYVEKAARKVRVVKLRNEKRVDNVNDRDKVEDGIEEISPMEKNRFPRANGKKAAAGLEESLMQTRRKGFEKSSLKSQGNQATYESPTRCDTKKTANSKSLASGDAELAGAKKASKKIKKDVTSNITNKGKREIKNFPSSSPSPSRSDDYAEEKENSKSDESDVENENAGRSFVMRNDHHLEIRNTEGFQNSLQKSPANQIVNISSLTDGEQDTRSHENDEPGNVQGHNFDIRLAPSMSKRLNCETKIIWIKEEPKSDCSPNEFDCSIDQEKILNTCENVCKEEDSLNKLLTKNDDTMPNETVKPAKTIANRKTDCTRHEKSVKDIFESFQLRRIDGQERRKTRRVKRYEEKIQKTMARFSDQVVRLVKDMGYLLEDDESSSSYSSEEESSYSSFSDYSCSCSCSCCDSSSSDEYSEYTLCSCSNCSSSYRDTDTDTDSDNRNEE